MHAREIEYTHGTKTSTWADLEGDRGSGPPEKHKK